jgi:hypothetical protein
MFSISGCSAEFRRTCVDDRVVRGYRVTWLQLHYDVYAVRRRLSLVRLPGFCVRCSESLHALHGRGSCASLHGRGRMRRPRRRIKQRHTKVRTQCIGHACMWNTWVCDFDERSNWKFPETCCKEVHLVVENTGRLSIGGSLHSLALFPYSINCQ